MLGRNFFGRGPAADFGRRRSATRDRGWPPRGVLSLLGMPLLVLGVWAAEMPQSDAQGLLRRLESRIRSRIDGRLQQRPPQDRAPQDRAPQDRAPQDRAPSGPRPFGPRPDGDAFGPGESSPPLPSRSRSARPAYGPGSTADANREPAGPASVGIEAVQHRGATPGLEVVEFAPHSLADEAGLRVGDVIVAVDGAATTTAAAAGQQLRQHPVGEMVQLRVLRSGALRELTVPLVATTGQTAARREAPLATREAPLGRRQPPASGAETGDRPRRQPAEPRQSAASPVTQPPETQPAAGREDDWLERPGEAPVSGSRQASDASPPAPTGDASLGAEWRDIEGQHGTRVRSVGERSPAEVAGLRVGDRIVSVQGRVVTDAETLAREIARRRPGDDLLLQWVRGDSLMEAEVTLAGPDGLARTTEPAARNGADGAAEPSRPQSMIEGVGSMLGGFFSGGQSSPKESSKPGSTDASSAGEPQSAAEQPSPPEEAGDEQEAGDGSRDDAAEADAAEPLPAPAGTPEAEASDQATGAAAGESAIRRASGVLQQLGDRDPPSLKQITPPERSLSAPRSRRGGEKTAAEPDEAASEPDETASQTNVQETVEQLRAEIERLKRRIEQLENR